MPPFFIGVHMKFIELLSKIFKNVPFITDPKTNTGSLTLTLTVISFNVCNFILFLKMTIFVLSISGKLDPKTVIDSLKIIDDVYTESASLFLISIGGYLGRKYQAKSGSMQVQFEEENKSNSQAKQ